MPREELRIAKEKVKEGKTKEETTKEENGDC
jgi:hypothetical protein